MKKIISILCCLLWCIIIYASKPNCTGGDQNPNDSENPREQLADSASSIIMRSLDPNELVGPQGYDSLQWVSVNDELHYIVYFENDAEFATANAQVVDVRIPLPEQEMTHSFSLGEFRFALQTYDFGVGNNVCQTRIDLRDSMNIYVDLSAGINREQQQVFWHFKSIDPVTGYAPWQANRGMLPVNDSTHIGEGYVSFSVRPAESMHTGDTISMIAHILFDQNDTIPTNRWRNRIDAGAPVSRILAEQDEENTLLYHLSFFAEDDAGGCGVKRVLLYQEDHTGIYQEMGAYPQDTTFDMQLEMGESFNLMSIAEDHVGNREAFKSHPDAILNANLPPSDILLSDSLFRDDLPAHGYIGTLTGVDTEGDLLTYDLAEGEGAIHNEFFVIAEDQLLLNESLQCADDSVFSIRIRVTDQGGLSFCKTFNLYMSYVLPHPDVETTVVTICDEDSVLFHGVTYTESGIFQYVVPNEGMCDSVYKLILTVLPVPQKPLITIANGMTLVSSAAEGNRWYRTDSEQPIDSTNQSIIPDKQGNYYVIVSNGSCVSESSDTVIVQWRTDSISLSLTLEQGWNWIASNLSDPTNRIASTFLAPIAEQVDSLCGDIPIVTDIDPATSYKIHTNTPVSNTWIGLPCNPYHFPITLRSGWNRIGYLLAYTTRPDNAWSGLVPEEGDILKSYDEFAVYSGGSWKGTLQTLSPGIGYMYYSQSVKSMLYNLDSAYIDVHPMRHAPAIHQELPWAIRPHAYPDNMPLVAQLQAGDQIVPEGMYTVAAFRGDECVGFGEIVEGKICMLVYGQDNSHDKISFKAYDNITSTICDINEQIHFGNDVISSFAEPYVLHLSPANAVTYTLSQEYMAYPNPVRSHAYITGNTNEIQRIEIYSSAGIRVMELASYPANGINVGAISTGTYLMVIHTVDASHVCKITKQADTKL